MPGRARGRRAQVTTGGTGLRPAPMPARRREPELPVREVVPEQFADRARIVRGPTRRRLLPWHGMNQLPRSGCVALWFAASLSAQESASRATEHTLAGFPQGVYFTIAAKQPPAAGKKQALLVVLPGGDGSREFLPFVENGVLGAVPDDCMGVLVTSVKWRDDQQVVWPTATSKVPGMQWTTEAFVAAVVKAVQKEHAVDPKRTAVLAWSSSGPAVYPMLLDPKAPFARGYVAMSVWRPANKKDLAGVKGRRIVLDQSPDDRVTAFSHASDAYAALSGAGAVVQLSTYAGGHGWQDAPLVRLRRNLAWLFSDAKADAPQWPEGTEPSKDGNLLRNGGFEAGAASWQTVDNSKTLTVAAVVDEKVEGKHALHVAKTGAMPLDLVQQQVGLPAGKKVRFSCQVKTKDCKNAWLKLWVYDASGKPVDERVDVAQLRGSSDWSRCEKVVELGSGTRAVVQLVLVMGGEVWLDDCRLEVLD